MRRLIVMLLALLTAFTACAEEAALDLFCPADFLRAWNDCLEVSLVSQLAEQTEEKEADVRDTLTLREAEADAYALINGRDTMLIYFGGTVAETDRAEFIVCDATNDALVRIFSLALEMVSADFRGLYTWTKTAPADDSYMFGPYYVKYTAGDTYTLLVMEA